MVQSKDSIESNFSYRSVGSGKAALSLVYEFLNETKGLSVKTSKIHVGRYMGTWVYLTLAQHGMLASGPLLDANYIHLYHQFGYPSRLSENLRESGLRVIEDYAHSLFPPYSPPPMEWGKLGFTSSTKFTGRRPHAFLVSDDAEFEQFVDDKLRQSKKATSYFPHSLFWVGNHLGGEFAKRVFGHAYVDFPVAIHSLVNVPQTIRSLEVEYALRVHRENELKAITPNASLPADWIHQKVAKYRLIIDSSAHLHEEYFQRVKPSGIEIVHFDWNQNPLNQDFRKSLAINPGSEIDALGWQKIIEFVSSAYA